MESPQTKPGTMFTPGRRAKDAGSRSADPLNGGGKDVQTSTHYDRVADSGVTKAPGERNDASQNLRGYVRSSSQLLGPIQDVTVASDGTRRVQGDKGGR